MPRPEEDYSIDLDELSRLLSNSEREAIKRYRKRHPERVDRWRFNASLNYCRRYVALHPELRELMDLTI